MIPAFPDFPEPSGIQRERPFSLPQQNYVLAQFFLEHCCQEAQLWLEGEYPMEELTQMDLHTRLACVRAYREQLGYHEAVELLIEAKSQLLAWGIEQLEQGPQTPYVVEILAKKELIFKRPRLEQRFIELCMKMIPKE